MSPTITTPALMTGVGVILGTAAYMSPEQAKGRSADKRSDIWAFGCVVYEMLSARRAFDGDDVAETLAAVIRGEPDWSALPGNVPPAIAAVLKRCIVKDRRERISDAAAVLFVLRESSGIGGHSLSVPSATVAPSRWRGVASYLVVSVAVAALTSTAWWFLRPSVQSPLVTRFTLTTPDDARLIATVQRVVAVSRDGTKVAYQTNRGVFVRPIANTDEKVVQIQGVYPVFSPDGESIAFYAPVERAIRKLSLSGGSPVTLSEGADSPSGISWHGEHIVFGQGEGGILRVSQDGGKSEVLVKPQPGEQTVAPHILPDGDTLLYTVAPEAGERRTWTWDQARIVVQSLTSGQQKTVVSGASDGHYVSTGHLLYAIGGVLFAQPFDLRRWETTGGRVPVVDGVRRGGAVGGTIQNTRLFSPTQLAVSDNGTLVYVPGPSSPSALRMQLLLTDRSGTVLPLKLPPGPYEFPRSSPDGSQIAYETDDGKDAHIWVYLLDGSASPRRLTLEGHNRFPIWSGDGQWVAFQSDREGDLGIFRQRADSMSGKGERLTRPDSGIAHAPESWSPDGKSLLFSSTKGSDVTLHILSLPDGTVKPFPGVQSDRWPNAVFSPDGQRVAYSIRTRDERRNTLYVEPFPPTGEKGAIAGGDAQMPVWSPDGRELLFVDPSRFDNGRVGFSRVTIDVRRGFTVGPALPVPRRFNVTAPGIERPRTFDILPDGRFVGVVDEDQTQERSTRIEVVVNWFEELKRLMP
jgi:serine/threonine-protein kinase